MIRLDVINAVQYIPGNIYLKQHIQLERFVGRHGVIFLVGFIHIEQQVPDGVQMFVMEKIFCPKIVEIVPIHLPQGVFPGDDHVEHQQGFDGFRTVGNVVCRLHEKFHGITVDVYRYRGIVLHAVVERCRGFSSCTHLFHLNQYGGRFFNNVLVQLFDVTHVIVKHVVQIIDALVQ